MCAVCHVLHNVVSLVRWYALLLVPSPQAVEQRRKADDITAVLYPNDATQCVLEGCSSWFTSLTIKAVPRCIIVAAGGPIAAACSGCRHADCRVLICAESSLDARYGKELRLKQQFFFVSASLQDTIARHLVRRLMGIVVVLIELASWLLPCEVPR